MPRRLRSVFLASSLAVAAAAEAEAQRAPDVRDFYFGAGLNVTSIRLDAVGLIGGSGRRTGPGLNVYLGHNIASYFGAVLSGTMARISPEGANDVTFGHGDLSFRFSHPGGTPFVPYGEAGVTSFRMDDRVDGQTARWSGVGFGGAAGFDYFFSEKFAVDMNVRYTGGKFRTLRIGGERLVSIEGIEMNTVRLTVGIVVFPTAYKESLDSRRYIRRR